MLLFEFLFTCDNASVQKGSTVNCANPGGLDGGRRCAGRGLWRCLV